MIIKLRKEKMLNEDGSVMRTKPTPQNPEGEELYRIIDVTILEGLLNTAKIKEIGGDVISTLRMQIRILDAIYDARKAKKDEIEISEEQVDFIKKLVKDPNLHSLDISASTTGRTLVYLSDELEKVAKNKPEQVAETPTK